MSFTYTIDCEQKTDNFSSWWKRKHFPTIFFCRAYLSAASFKLKKSTLMTLNVSIATTFASKKKNFFYCATVMRWWCTMQSQTYRVVPHVLYIKRKEMYNEMRKKYNKNIIKKQQRGEMKEKLNIRSLTWEREKRRLMNEVGVFGVVLRLVSDVSARKKNNIQFHSTAMWTILCVCCIASSFYPKTSLFLSYTIFFGRGHQLMTQHCISVISIRWCIHARRGCIHQIIRQHQL